MLIENKILKCPYIILNYNREIFVKKIDKRCILCGFCGCTAKNNYKIPMKSITKWRFCFFCDSSKLFYKKKVSLNLSRCEVFQWEVIPMCAI